ncbi:hypothetical protein KIN20_013557 [Parelaphostrongylus tenuis]|uniref:Uncharacterized protein n=1 Tax=Parelaphostrongylus tenuis TaxID=148309 RepID=A0AAD5MUR5_PARTN|nr:hypothetical protein KIN20_013557 [Parelaphostrongylus tenuis]
MGRHIPYSSAITIEVKKGMTINFKVKFTSAAKLPPTKIFKLFESRLLIRTHNIKSSLHVNHGLKKSLEQSP